MIRVVLIDDERPALRELSHLLGQFGDVEIAGAYTDPHAGLDAIAELQPQAVFLDIHMPQLMGTDAASTILDRCQDTRIVFVTAYDKYAVEAFELYALDYVLKPVSASRLEKTIERLRENGVTCGGGTKRLSIRCLGEFEIGRDNEEPLKWRTEKTLELFAYLLHNKGRTVRKSEIIGAIWPDAVFDRADHQLHNAVYYIRKTLSDYGVPREQLCVSGCYRLDLNGIETDVDRFKKRCLQMKTQGGADGWLDLYKGAYFAGSGWLWAEPERARLERDFVLTTLTLATTAMDEGRFDDAEALLCTAYQHVPCEESITMLLLELFARTGDKAKAVTHYKQYCKTLKTELGIRPSRKLIQSAKSVLE